MLNKGDLAIRLPFSFYVNFENNFFQIVSLYRNVHVLIAWCHTVT